MGLIAFKCPFCKIYFSSKNKLKFHYAIHCPRYVNARVKCGYCKSDFLSLNDLKNHWNIFFCRKFCACFLCKNYFDSLPIVDGFVENIYIVMFTKNTINLSQKEVMLQLKNFSAFGPNITWHPWALAIFHKIEN